MTAINNTFNSNSLGNRLTLKKPSNAWMDVGSKLKVVGPTAQTATVVPKRAETPQTTTGLQTTGFTRPQSSPTAPIQLPGTTGQVGSVGAPAPVLNSRGGIDKQSNKEKQSGTQGQTGFQGLVGRVAGASAPTKTQTGLVSDIQRLGQGNLPIGEEARRISADYGQRIAETGRLGAGAVAGNLSTGTNVVGSGNAAIASQSASQRMTALSQAQEAALKGTAQQLTAQNQAAGAFGTALGGANTQQAQQITGLGTAAGYAQPVQAPYSSALYNPMTGGMVTQGGLGGYAGYNAAEQTMALIRQYPDANYQYNPNLSPEQNLQMAQKAVQSSPTWQKGTYGVPGQTGIPGATVIQGAQQGYTSAIQEYNNLYTAYTNADTLADNALAILEEGGINPTDARYANQAIQNVKRQLSSVQQQKFDTALQEMQNAFAGLIASYGGQTPTEVVTAYERLLNPNSSMEAIATSIEQLRNAGQVRLNAEYQRVGTYYNQLGGAGGTGGGGLFDW